MSDVFDLDGYVAENMAEPYRFTYHSREWELPHLSWIDLRVTEAADKGDLAAIRELFRVGLGESQWADFNELPQPSAAMGELFRRWRAHAGLAPGESQASPSSSESTAGPSTRRSAGTAARRSGARSRGN